MMISLFSLVSSLTIIFSKDLFILNRSGKQKVLRLIKFLTFFCLGTNGINWVTEDCGGNISALNAGKFVQEFMFHPT